MLVNLSSLGLGLGSLTRRKTANLEDTLEQVADSLSGLLLLYRARKKRIELITGLETANEQDEQEIEYCRQQIAFLMQKEEENHKRALAVVTSGAGSIGTRLRAGGTPSVPADELASQYYWDDTSGDREVAEEETSEGLATATLAFSTAAYEETENENENETEEAYPDYEGEGTEAAGDGADEVPSSNSNSSSIYLPLAALETEAEAETEAAELDLGDTDFSLGAEAGETEETAEIETGGQLLLNPTQPELKLPKVAGRPSPAEQELEALLAELDNLSRSEASVPSPNSNSSSRSR